MFKNHNRRDAADTETGAEFPFRLGIHFDETDFTAALFWVQTVFIANL